MKKNKKTIIIVAVAVVVIAVVVFFVLKSKKQEEAPSTSTDTESEPEIKSAGGKSKRSDELAAKINEKSLKDVVGRVGFYQNKADTKSLPEAELIAKAAFDAYSAGTLDYNQLGFVKKYSLSEIKEAAY